MKATATSVRDAFGRPCIRNPKYPLWATCSNCGHELVALDGTAEWTHSLTKKATCDASAG